MSALQFHAPSLPQHSHSLVFNSLTHRKISTFFFTSIPHLRAYRNILKKAREQADIIEVTKQELEFLLDEEYYERSLQKIYEYYEYYTPQYCKNFEQPKRRRDYYHYTREEISPLWHDGLKFLFVWWNTSYPLLYSFVVVGTEDVLITPFHLP